MRNKNIALIYAGGTIGMTRTASGYAPSPDFPDLLRRAFDSAQDALPGYTLICYPQPIDSSNATPDDWVTIARDIAARYDDHDGFVVLHGTDTMAFTASALSFMLQGLGKPVILTGAQIPIEAPRSDGLPNLVGALQLAAAPELNEVGVFFGQRLLRGNRSTKVSSEAFTAFDSPNYPALAEAGIHLRWNRQALLARAARTRFELADYRARVFSHRFAPGQPQQALDALLASKPDALILECYGSGNVPDRDPALLAALAKASDAGTVLVARSQCAHGSVALGAYAVGSGMAAAGVVGAGDMSFEAIYTKLHHLFARGLDADGVRTALLQGVAGELTE